MGWGVLLQTAPPVLGNAGSCDAMNTAWCSTRGVRTAAPATSPVLEGWVVAGPTAVAPSGVAVASLCKGASTSEAGRAQLSQADIIQIDARNAACSLATPFLVLLPHNRTCHTITQQRHWYAPKKYVTCFCTLVSLFSLVSLSLTQK